VILAGSDFSRSSDAALRLATAWARRDARPIRVVHVLEAEARQLPEHERDLLLRELSEQAHRAGASETGASVECEVAAGDAATVLAGMSGDLLVVGAEGGSATLLRRAGHVAAMLAATRPPRGRVLVAPQGWAVGASRRRRSSSPRPPPRALAERVMVACSLSGGDASRIALAARLLADVPASEMHLVHVVDVSAARHHPATSRSAMREATDERARVAGEALRDLAAEVPLELAASRDVRLHVVRQGPIERDLAGLAESQAIDLIVAGPGAVASRLTGFIRCPLLVAG